MKKFLALMGTYAAGLAVAMKLRKDSGKSKLAEDTKNTTLGNVIDEIVDIHRTAYNDIKSFVTPIFDDIQDFEGLKAKVAEMIDGFSDKVESSLADLKAEGEEKKMLALQLLDDAYSKADGTMQKAKAKAATLDDTAEDMIAEWIDEGKKKLESAYKKLKMKFDKMA